MSVIKHLLSTEKAVRMMEAENKLTFIVENNATKPDIKKAMQEQFKVKIVAVNTTVTPDGKKKAFIKLAPENPALDIATQLGAI
ncbi:MAG TPA: 50S ribosomal protein L23 [Candidatus Nanoarchaeia archaeon]|nr:50S ribosomal protein L23 [Candidatus Nanoarchaeia archaeon]